ncbi:MAG: hypothetical protein KIT87_17130 [Anaerolineae bacterium]|nr:hypothetical protein [Anaerolineae bacterium]
MARLIIALAASAVCMMLLAVQSRPAQAAVEDVTSVVARPCADEEGTEAAATCILRLRQPLADTYSYFGEKIFLGQTFVAPQGRRVCKVDLLLTKHQNVLFGDPVLAQIQTLGGAVLDSTFIPSGIMPLGVPAWQTFNFGCDGGDLIAGQTYRLVIFSRPNTPRDAFQWHHNSASVITGQAQRKYDLGAFNNIAPLGSDFAFRLYMCY